MSEFAEGVRKEIEEEDYKKQKAKAERAVKAKEPKKAAKHLRSASEHLDSLAELTDLPSPKQKYNQQAEEFREVASELESKGISSVAETDSAGQSSPSTGGNDDEFGLSDEAPNVSVETPDLTFSDVGGMTDLKQTLLAKVADPVRRKNLYKQYDIDPIKGVLFQGPPGTGKTHITRALAGELGWDFIELSPADITSALVGEGAKNIKDIFQTAKENQPCLLFFDEIDSVAVDRTGSTQGTQSEQMMLTQLLTEMNKIDEEDVIVIGATNAPEEVDKALLNATRFSEVIEVPLPDAEARKAILRVHLRDRPILQENINFERVAELTEGFSGADMEAVSADAARNALTEAEESGSIVPIEQTHIETAIQERRKSKDDSRKGGYLDGDV